MKKIILFSSCLACGACNMPDIPPSASNLQQQDINGDSCIVDDVNQLMWEIKSNDGGLRDKSWTYTWYDSNPITNGGESGIADTGISTTSNYQAQPNIDVAGSDNCFDPITCDIEQFVQAVNSQTLCGAGNTSQNPWRVPSAEELKTLVFGTREFNGIIERDPFSGHIEGTPFINSAFFPNTVADFFWTADASPTNVFQATSIEFAIPFENTDFKRRDHAVRLVRTLP